MKDVPVSLRINGINTTGTIGGFLRDLICDFWEGNKINTDKSSNGLVGFLEDVCQQQWKCRRGLVDMEEFDMNISKYLSKLWNPLG